VSPHWGPPPWGWKPEAPHVDVYIGSGAKLAHDWLSFGLSNRYLVSMLTYIEKFRDGAVFGPEDIVILAEAYESAWASVVSSGAPFGNQEYADEAREIIARHIILAAKVGERDARRLSDGALLQLSRISMRSPPKLRR
jgi:hypothetical protein